MIGGQEDEQENPTNDIQDYIDQLDYDSLTNEIDHTNLDDSYKAEFEITITSSVSYELGISIQTDDGDWHVSPASVAFDPTTQKNKFYFYSQKLYSYLENAYVTNRASDLSSNFHSNLENYRQTQLKQIQDNYDTQMSRRQEVYDQALKQAEEEHQQKIDQAQEVSDSLEEIEQQGGRYLKKLRNRSRKLIRKNKK